MKTLIKLANSCKNIKSIHGNILFEGKSARATSIDTHAGIESGPWEFDCATVVSVQQIKAAMVLSKKPVWSGNTLNGIPLTNCGDVNDWIPLPEFKGTQIDCADLPAKLARILPAVADRDIRYTLNGICFDHSEKNIIATDGFRMHIIKNAYTSELTGQAIVPRDAFNLVGAKNIIHMDFTTTHCRIGYIGGYLITKLIAGKFPDYARVLPDNNKRPNNVIFGQQQIAAVKSIVAACNANKVKFPTIYISSDGKLTACDISVPCFDHWTVTSPVNIENWQPAPALYTINAKYLHDALLCADQGTIGVDTATDSILVNNDNFYAVVMPCRV